MFVFGERPRLAWGMNEQGTEPTSSDEVDDSADAIAAPPQAPLIRWPIYHGWWIVLVGAVLWGLIGFGESYALLDQFWLSDLDGWTISLILASIGGSTFLLLLPGRPLVGMFSDRYGYRVVLLPVLLLAAFSIGALSVFGGPWSISGIGAFVLNLSAAVLPISLAVATANLFHRNLGIALAVLLTGPALAQLIPTFIFDMPVIGHAMVRAILLGDSDTLFLSQGDLLLATALLIGTGLMALILWRKPHDQSTQPAHLSPVGSNSGSVWQILKSRNYVFFVGALALQVIGISALLSAVSSTSPSLRTILPAVELFDPFVVPPLLSISGLLVTGWLSDRYDRRKIVAWIIAAQILTAPIIVLYAEGAASLLLAISFGIGFGATGAANLALQAELWGCRHFGVLMGTQMSIISLAAAPLAPIGLWFIHEEIPTSAALLLAIIPLAIALILILLMKRPQLLVGGAAESQVAV